MKKQAWLALFLTLILTAGCVAPALAGGFTPIRVNGNLRLAVYSAPSFSSWRGANGKAMCNTDGEVKAAGRVGGWVLIMYYLNHGSNAGGCRVGYVQYSELVGLMDNIPPLTFQNTPATINSSCVLTDDPDFLQTPITYLSSGAHVTYLMGYQNDYGVRYAYIETTFQGKTVRGFVQWDAISTGW